MKEMLGKFYTKYKTIIYPFFVGIASLTLVILVIIPQIKGYLGSKDSELKIQNRLKILESKAKELENINDDELRRKVQSAVAALPTEKDYTSVIGFLQRLSAEAGINLESVILDSGGAKNTAIASSFAVKVEINAGKLNFDEFLKKIENAPSVLKISNISVDRGTDDLISSSLVIDVFYSPTPNTLGSIDSPLPKLTSEEEVLIQELVSSLAVVPVTSVSSKQPENILPRGKSNPFE